MLRHVSKQKENKRKEKEKTNLLRFLQVYVAPVRFAQIIFHLELLDWVQGLLPPGSTFLLLSLPIFFSVSLLFFNNPHNYDFIQQVFIEHLLYICQAIF